MKNRLLLISLLLVFLSGTTFAQKKNTRSPSEKIHRMVFHLSSPDTAVYRAVTRQISNVLAYWPTARIEVVVQSKGIGFMKREQNILENEISALQSKGVVFAVCENTMKQQKLAREQILPQAIFVPVGIAEVVLRQEEGWAYLKAGF